MTTPDMSLTVKKLLEDHSRGLHSDVHVAKGEYFHTEIPIFQDITERYEYAEQLKERLKEVNKNIKDELAKKPSNTPDIPPITPDLKPKQKTDGKPPSNISPEPSGNTSND